MPGEAYVQCILNQLNEIEIKGVNNINHMLSAIGMLERLKEDIISHKAKPEDAEPTECQAELVEEL